MKNEPAFPCPDHDGLSLRDYFAAKAMQGVWANSDLLTRLPRASAAQQIAAMAYEQADAMLEERKK